MADYINLVYDVLIVAKCIVNKYLYICFPSSLYVLIVAKCIVNTLKIIKMF